MNNILLIGASGFIGSFLYKELKNKFPITSIDYSTGTIENDFFTLDLTQKPEIKDFAKKCTQFDTLIFLVGLAHKKGKGRDLSVFRNINTQTLINLLSALKEQGKLPDKIIFASTISVYGEKYQQNIYDEESEKHSFSPYAVTKLEAENYLLDRYVDKSWILRFSPVYSPGFLLNINRRTKIRDSYYRVGKGVKKLSLCNIENIETTVNGIIQGNVPSGIYNLSDTKEYTYNDLLTWNNAKKVIRIPQFAVKLLYIFGKIINKTFLKENTIKLITDNIFPSDKIRSFINLPATLNDVKPGND